MIATISRFTSERIALKQFRNAHRFFQTAMMLSVLLGMAGSLILFFCADFIVDLLHFPEGTVYSVQWIAPSVFIVSILTVFRGYFQGMKTTTPTAISQVIEQIANVIFSLWLAFLFYDPESVHLSAAGVSAGTAIAAIAALGCIVFIYFLVAKTIKKRAIEDTSEYIEPRRTQIAAISKMAYPLIISASVFSIASILDISMANNRLLGVFSEDEVNVLVGQFTGKFVLLTTLPVSISMAFSAAVIPEIASSHVTFDKAAVQRKTNLALRISMIIAIPASVGLAVLADPVIGLIFPMQPEGGWMLRYGAVSIVFLSLVHVITGVLQGVGYVKIPIIGVLFGVLVKIPINYYLISIPEINVLGAVISTGACFIIAAVINLFFLKLFTGILPEVIGTFVKPIIAAAGMGFVCYTVYNLLYIVSSNAISAVSAIVAGLISYLALMGLIKGFGEDELAAIPIPRRIRRWLSL
jgi:stage V sporulation protein B